MHPLGRIPLLESIKLYLLIYWPFQRQKMFFLKKIRKQATVKLRQFKWTVQLILVKVKKVIEK